MTEGGTQLFAGLLRLVPYSGVQFCDVALPHALVAGLKSRFIVDQFELGGDTQRVLLPLDEAAPAPSIAQVEAAGIDGVEAPPTVRARPAAPERLLHPVTGRTVDPAAILEIGGEAAISRFVNTWTPIPYLRFVGRDERQRPRFDAGPSNWARVFVAPGDGEPAAPVGLTLAFDTALLQQSRLDAAAYLAPNTDDAAFGSTFMCASTVDDIPALLAEPWLESWLAEHAARHAAAAPADVAATGPAAQSSEHAQLAHYLTFLRLLTAAGVLPEVRFTDTIQRRFPIRDCAVDLILDIGDSETTALLVDVPHDGQPEQASAVGYAEAMRLRDLDMPWVIHEGAIPTTAEFDGLPFGEPKLSRDSGRLEAFQWPSLVRIGQEARRLALRGNGTEGVTGLSNLRSFLLDDNASPGLWRQSTDDRSPHGQGPMVSGTVLQYVGENGSVIGADTPDLSLLALTDQRPAIRPRFSRASMIGFFAAELVLHALSQINSAARDAAHPQETEVRQLRQVLVLAPATFSQGERQALVSRVDQGLLLVWRALGWDLPAPGIPPRPVVALGLGGDLGTQIAFLHNEVMAKYQGRFRDLLRVYRGGDTAGSAAESLRVASVEFGARTTSLTIVDYAAAEGSVVASEWNPTVRVQERLPVGTDAALQALIWTVLLPAIEVQLAASGLDPARHFLDEITGRSTTSLLVEDPYFTRRLNRKILWPAANGLFALTQSGAVSLSYGNRSVSLATLVELGGGRMDGVAAAFDAAALQAGARGFVLEATKIELARGQLSHIVRQELDECVQQVCRIVGQNACDLLLLGGEGTQQPTIREAVLAATPVQASRIIDLNAHVNQAASEAVGTRGLLPSPAMLPAIACALDRRHLLDASGFSSLSLSRLAISPPSAPPAEQKAIGGPRARDDAADRVVDRPSTGRVGSLPAKGG